jgi:hypothetical protein
MRTTIALACAAAAVSAGAALGARPVEPVQVLRIDETETIPAGALCAFPVQIRTVGHVRIKVEQNRFFSRCPETPHGERVLTRVHPP